jgi:KDEL-tailed cysteine endopeptidase
VNGGKLYVLSTQEVVDCDTNDYGCNGGFIDGAYEAIISLGGLCTAAAYPYTGQQGTCRSHDCTPVVKISGYKDVQKNSDVALATAVAQQPVGISMEADQTVFQFYGSGVITGQCGANLDHTLLAVGYGELNKVQYYKMQNVWGTSWGMNGYVLIARGESYNNGAGQCGIYSEASYPTQ